MARVVTLMSSLGAVASAATFTVPIEATAPENASVVLPRDYMSFSIESSDFPDFGGNDTHPNHFTKNLIANLARETGELPVVRIGGATIERSKYVADQEEALIPFWDYEYNLDQPKNMTIGPAYWQSLTQLQSVARYILDLNFVKNDTDYIYNLRASVNETFNQVDHDKIHLFEIGNENDVDVSQSFRPANWTVADYAEEWVNRSRAINEQHGGELRFMAPSLSSMNPDFSPYDMLSPDKLDMDRDGWITEISQHLYMTGAQNHPRLQEHLMNHTVVMKQAYWPVDFARRMLEEGRFFTIGETNSIYGQGAESVSDVFGAALWEVDYGLWMASNNVRRLHFHQGTSYRYASWLPIKVNETEAHVRPPYYGNVFLSRFIGSSGKTQVANYPLDDHVNVAYAAYDDGELARIALVNMREYNGTDSAASAREPKSRRPSSEFRFPAPKGCKKARVARLHAPQAHSTEDITIDGVMYSYEHGLGMPIRVTDDSKVVRAKDGEFTVKVEASGAVMITLL